MKSRDVESDFELYVTRTPGYLWALFFRWLHVHPITVTLMSIVIGSASGFFFYSDNLYYNLVGMLMLVWANWFDCADGQLARMTGKTTLIGRILDGFGGDVWFFFIYIGLLLRLWPEWGVYMFILEAWAGFYCHAGQCRIADYYRNIHLWVTLGKGRSELDKSADLLGRMQSLRWNKSEWFEKLYLFFYARYTRLQERHTPEFQHLRSLLEKNPPSESLVEQFRSGSKPLMPLCNIITFDTRVGVLFLSLIVGHPWIYFVFEVTVLELVRYYVHRKHEMLCRELSKKLTSI